MLRAMLAVVLIGCGPGDARRIDAGVDAPIVVVPPECPALPDVATFNFFGESCVIIDPDPRVNTLCRGLDGWCIAGVCRPDCALAPDRHCPACPVGATRFAPAGACYCQPPQ